MGSTWTPAWSAAAGLALWLAGAAPAAAGDIYGYVDEKGQWHFVDDLARVPAKYRDQAGARQEAVSRLGQERYSVVSRQAPAAPRAEPQGRWVDSDAPAAAAPEARAEPEAPAGMIRIRADGSVIGPDDGRRGVPPRRAGRARAALRPDGGEEAPEPQNRQVRAPTREERIADLERRRERMVERVTLLEEGFVDGKVHNPEHADLDRLIENASSAIDRIDGQITDLKSGGNAALASGVDEAGED